MCEEIPIHYKDGDIVWVKLDLCWWPGKVIDFDALPEDYRDDFKTGQKRPLVVVSFFQEKHYEFVKNVNRIYSYNCTKKDEFIKRAMDLFRAKKGLMDKFPDDVKMAEELTGGNQDILNDPKFESPVVQPRNSWREVFASPKAETPPSSGKGRQRNSTKTPRKSNGKNNSPKVVEQHLPKKNYSVRMLIQNRSEPEESQHKYTCDRCDFETTRIDVIIIHKKGHIEDKDKCITTVSRTPGKTPRKNKRKLKFPVSKTNTIDEDIALLEQGISLTDHESDCDEEFIEIIKGRTKRKSKTGVSPKKSIKKKAKVEQKKDIRVDLLAEWDDEDEDESQDAAVNNNESLDTAELNKTTENENISSEKASTEEEKTEDVSTAKDEDKSCFDFEEEEDNQLLTAATSSGRKIPRVIPEKRKSLEPNDDLAKLDEVKPEDKNETASKDDDFEEELNKFAEVLETTAAPITPELPPSKLKCEQNFHYSKAKKSPDKSKMINIKKRFVKSFEDFEQSVNVEMDESGVESIRQIDSTEKQMQNESISGEKQFESEKSLDSSATINELDVQPQAESMNEDSTVTGTDELNNSAEGNKIECSTKAKGEIILETESCELPLEQKNEATTHDTPMEEIKTNLDDKLNEEPVESKQEHVDKAQEDENQLKFESDDQAGKKQDKSKRKLEEDGNKEKEMRLEEDKSEEKELKLNEDKNNDNKNRDVSMVSTRSKDRKSYVSKKGEKEKVNEDEEKVSSKNDIKLPDDEGRMNEVEKPASAIKVNDEPQTKNEVETSQSLVDSIKSDFGENTKKVEPRKGRKSKKFDLDQSLDTSAIEETVKTIEVPKKPKRKSLIDSKKPKNRHSSTEKTFEITRTERPSFLPEDDNVIKKLMSKLPSFSTALDEETKRSFFTPDEASTTCHLQQKSDDVKKMRATRSTFSPELGIQEDSPKKTRVTRSSLPDSSKKISEDKEALLEESTKKGRSSRSSLSKKEESKVHAAEEELQTREECAIKKTRTTRSSLASDEGLKIQEDIEEDNQHKQKKTRSTRSSQHNDEELKVPEDTPDENTHKTKTTKPAEVKAKTRKSLLSKKDDLLSVLEGTDESTEQDEHVVKTRSTRSSFPAGIDVDKKTKPGDEHIETAPVDIHEKTTSSKKLKPRKPSLTDEESNKIKPSKSSSADDEQESSHLSDVKHKKGTLNKSLSVDDEIEDIKSPESKHKKGKAIKSTRADVLEEPENLKSPELKLKKGKANKSTPVEHDKGTESLKNELELPNKAQDVEIRSIRSTRSSLPFESNKDKKSKADNETKPTDLQEEKAPDAEVKKTRLTRSSIPGNLQQDSVKIEENKINKCEEELIDLKSATVNVETDVEESKKMTKPEAEENKIAEKDKSVEVTKKSKPTVEECTKKTRITRSSLPINLDEHSLRTRSVKPHEEVELNAKKTKSKTQNEEVVNIPLLEHDGKELKSVGNQSAKKNKSKLQTQVEEIFGEELSTQSDDGKMDESTKKVLPVISTDEKLIETPKKNKSARLETEVEFKRSRSTRSSLPHGLNEDEKKKDEELTPAKKSKMRSSQSPDIIDDVKRPKLKDEDHKKTRSLSNKDPRKSIDEKTVLKQKEDDEKKRSTSSIEDKLKKMEEESNSNSPKPQEEIPVKKNIRELPIKKKIKNFDEELAKIDMELPVKTRSARLSTRDLEETLKRGITPKKSKVETVRVEVEKKKEEVHERGRTTRSSGSHEAELAKIKEKKYPSGGEEGLPEIESKKGKEKKQADVDMKKKGAKNVDEIDKNIPTETHVDVAKTKKMPPLLPVECFEDAKKKKFKKYDEIKDTSNVDEIPKPAVAETPISHADSKKSHDDEIKKIKSRWSSFVVNKDKEQPDAGKKTETILPEVSTDESRKIKTKWSASASAENIVRKKSRWDDEEPRKIDEAKKIKSKWTLGVVNDDVIRKKTDEKKPFESDSDTKEDEASEYNFNEEDTERHDADNEIVRKKSRLSDSSENIVDINKGASEKESLTQLLDAALTVDALMRKPSTTVEVASQLQTVEVVSEIKEKHIKKSSFFGTRLNKDIPTSSDTFKKSPDEISVKLTSKKLPSKLSSADEEINKNITIDPIVKKDTVSKFTINSLAQSIRDKMADTSLSINEVLGKESLGGKKLKASPEKHITKKLKHRAGQLEDSPPKKKYYYDDMTDEVVEKKMKTRLSSGEFDEGEGEARKKAKLSVESEANENETDGECLKVSKLKSRLMDKLNETEIELQRPKGKTYINQKTEEKMERLQRRRSSAKSPRRLSIQSHEISIEKTSDNTVEVFNTVEDVSKLAVEECKSREDVKKLPIGESKIESLLRSPGLPQESDENSALNTLATISELSSYDLQTDINLEKNLTVVSESQLGDTQVEIAKIPIMEEGTVKATTVASFSVDFTEDLNVLENRNKPSDMNILSAVSPPTDYKSSDNFSVSESVTLYSEFSEKHMSPAEKVISTVNTVEESVTLKLGDGNDRTIEKCDDPKESAAIVDEPTIDKDIVIQSTETLVVQEEPALDNNITLTETPLVENPAVPNETLSDDTIEISNDAVTEHEIIITENSFVSIEEQTVPITEETISIAETAVIPATVETSTPPAEEAQIPQTEPIILQEDVTTSTFPTIKEDIIEDQLVETSELTEQPAPLDDDLQKTEILQSQANENSAIEVPNTVESDAIKLQTDVPPFSGEEVQFAEVPIESSDLIATDEHAVEIPANTETLETEIVNHEGEQETEAITENTNTDAQLIVEKNDAELSIESAASTDNMDIEEKQLTDDSIPNVDIDKSVESSKVYENVENNETVLAEASEEPSQHTDVDKAMFVKENEESEPVEGSMFVNEEPTIDSFEEKDGTEHIKESIESENIGVENIPHEGEGLFEFNSTVNENEVTIETPAVVEENADIIPPQQDSPTSKPKITVQEEIIITPDEKVTPKSKKFSVLSDVKLPDSKNILMKKVHISPKKLVQKKFMENSVEMEMAKLTDTSMDAAVVQQPQESTTSSKLLEILTDTKVTQSLKIANPKFEVDSATVTKPKTKLLIRSSLAGSSGKSVILSEKIVRSKDVTHRTCDAEGIETFVIRKKEALAKTPVKKPVFKSDPSTSAASDENVFDIDSMPIVLSDQILTADNIDNVPIMIQQEKMMPNKVRLLNKATGFLQHKQAVATTKGKVVMMQSEPSGSKYTVGKRIIKKSPVVATTGASRVQEPTGNKIMIVTNNQGQQSRVVLTPAQQKLIGYQGPGMKKVVKKAGANILSQTIINPKGQIRTTQMIATTQSSPMVMKKKIEASKTKVVRQRVSLQNSLNQLKPGQQRTIIIKNPQGQTVKTIHGSNDALLEQQVKEQIQAINRATLSQNAANKQTVVKKIIRKSPVSENTKFALQHKAQSSSSKMVPEVPPLSPLAKRNEPVAKPKPVSPTPSVSEVEKKERAPHQLVIQDDLGNQTTITEGQILALPSETVDGQPQSYMLVTLDETGNLTPLNNEALMSLDPNLNLGGDMGNMVLQIDQSGVNMKPAVESPAVPAVKPDIPAAPQEAALPVQEESPAIPKEAKVEEATTETPRSSQQAIACAINNGETNQQLIITGDPASTQKFLETLSEGNTDLTNLLANAEGNILIHADGQQILINTDSDNQMLLQVNPDGAPVTESNEHSGNPIFSSQVAKNQDILAAALADTDVFQADGSVLPSKSLPSQLSPSVPALYPINVNNVLETSSMNSPIMTPLEVPSNTKKIEAETDILTQVPKNVDLPITITDPNISQTVAHQQAALLSSDLHANLDLPLAIQDVTVTSAEMNSPSFGYSLPSLDDTVDMQKTFSNSISMPLLTEIPEDVVVTSAPIPEAMEVEVPENAIEETVTDEPMKIDEVSEKKNDSHYLLSTSGIAAINNQMCSSLSEPPPDMFDFSIDQGYDLKQQSMEISPTITESPVDDDFLEHDKTESESEQASNSPSTNSTDSCEIPVQPEIELRNFDEDKL